MIKIKHQYSPSIEDLLIRLKIPICDRVVEEINDCHLSQVLAALTCVDDGYENITDRVAYFLKILPEQRIEKLGSREPEIGSKMRAEYDHLTREMRSPEYKKAWQEQVKSKLPWNKRNNASKLPRTKTNSNQVRYSSSGEYSQIPQG